MSETEQDLDDYLIELGIETKPQTREDELYVLFTEGKYKKIDNCKLWLMHEMARFKHLKEENVLVVKYVFNGTVGIYKPLSILEYARLHLKYYLHMYHLVFFQELNGKPAADMDKIVDMLVAYEPIKEVINREY